MSDAIRVGFSMHPKWLGEGDLKTFVGPLRRAGLSALEFELDANLPHWKEFEPLMDEAADKGLDLSFHAPYRSPHTLKGFFTGSRDAIIKDYRPMLSIAESWGKRLDSIETVVIHAAISKQPVNRDDLIEDTREFLLWGLESFPHVRFALENNSPAKPGMVKVGERLEDVLDIVQTLEHPRLCACWDMGHDYLVRGPAPASQEWLAAVGHLHIHDVDEHDEDHYPLIFGRVPYQTWLWALKDTGRSGLAVLELKGGHLRDWPPELVGKALVRSVALIRAVVQ